MCGLALVSSVAGLCGFAQGCAAPARPDPMEVFREICNRSLNEDVEYVRGRLSPALLAAAGGHGAKVKGDEFVRALMHELQVCRPTRWEELSSPDKVVIEVAGVKKSTVCLFRIDMIYDGKHGWRLASRLYGERPLKPS